LRDPPVPRIFALGTLKRGFPLHEEGLKGALFLGHYRTVERYPMFVAGPWFAPMVMNEPGTGFQISGELFEVDEARLKKLDDMESIGKPGNFRQAIEVSAIEGDEVCKAFAYMKSRALAAPVHTGYLDDYQDRRFIPPHQRPNTQESGGIGGFHPINGGK
jgi:gamma-glutamylaminecyclotransferase